MHDFLYIRKKNLDFKTIKMTLKQEKTTTKKSLDRVHNEAANKSHKIENNKKKTLL